MIMFRVQKCYQPFIHGKHHDRFTNVLRAAQRYTLTTGKPCIFKAHQLYVVIRRNKLQKHELRHSLTAFGMVLFGHGKPICNSIRIAYIYCHLTGEQHEQRSQRRVSGRFIR